jgi:hypothetical protein
MFSALSSTLLQPRWKLAALLAGGAIASVAAIGASAQSLDSYFPTGVPGYDNGQGVTVQTRVRPDYDFPTYHLGNAEISPQLSESVGYNDNVYGTTNPLGSWLEQTRASISATSAFAHSGIGGSLSVNDLRYANASTLNETGGTASLGGSYDIGNARVSAAYSFLVAHENPGDIATSGFDKPITYYVNRFQANGALPFGRFVVTPAAEFDTWRFDNTSLRSAPVIESYRDRNVIQGTVTTRYQLSDLDSLLLVANVSSTHYISSLHDSLVATRLANGTIVILKPGFLAPDNNGYSLLAGVDFTPSGLLSYRVLVGYEVRTYDSSLVSTQTSPVAEASVTYTPTGLTTITATLARTIEDAASTDAAGLTYTSGHLQIDHELFRNILLNGRFTYQHADYIATPVQATSAQSVYGFGGAVTWLLNRYARVVASYDLAYTPNGAGANGVVGSGNNASISNLTMVSLQLGAF